MIVTLKMVPTKKNGKFFAQPCTMQAQFTVDMDQLARFNTLRRTGTAQVLGSDIEVLLKTVPRVFSEMFGVDVIEIGLPNGEIQIYDANSPKTIEP